MGFVTFNAGQTESGSENLKTKGMFEKHMPMDCCVLIKVNKNNRQTNFSVQCTMYIL